MPEARCDQRLCTSGRDGKSRAVACKSVPRWQDFFWWVVTHRSRCCPFVHWAVKYWVCNVLYVNEAVYAPWTRCSQLQRGPECVRHEWASEQLFGCKKIHITHPNSCTSSDHQEQKHFWMRCLLCDWMLGPSRHMLRCFCSTKHRFLLILFFLALHHLPCSDIRMTSTHTTESCRHWHGLLKAMPVHRWDQASDASQVSSTFVLKMVRWTGQSTGWSRFCCAALSQTKSPIAAPWLCLASSFRSPVSQQLGQTSISLISIWVLIYYIMSFWREISNFNLKSPACFNKATYFLLFLPFCSLALPWPCFSSVCW